uniref:Uncharacterized protein n=1 Tax=Acanthochromis polyacanthus TaxID=80966 RepID=A0A3Q1FPE9_9TELE
MPHFTVVPVKDQAQSSYDSLEGINWVDYRDTGQDYPDHQDTVSSDGANFSLLASLLQHVSRCHSLVSPLYQHRKSRAKGRQGAEREEFVAAG